MNERSRAELYFPHTARLLIQCPDRPGIIAAITQFFAGYHINITALNQHTTLPHGGVLFLRLEFLHGTLQQETFSEDFRIRVAEPWNMQWRIRYAADPIRVAVLVSKQDHALLELLWLHAQRELPGSLVCVISNHPEVGGVVERFGVPFVCIPVDPDHKAAAESALLAQLEAYAVETVVLARYMQILSARVVDRYPSQIVNIHHSFLPAFIGADPYRQAYDQGVKLIGATAHYVTEALDRGPIIEQDVIRVDHSLTVAALRALGRNIERTVLARAVRWHLEDRIWVQGNKTLVFH